MFQIFLCFKQSHEDEQHQQQQRNKTPSETHSSPHPGGGHRRSHSTHLERSHSPIIHQRSSSVAAGAAERSTLPHRSNSMNSGNIK